MLRIRQEQRIELRASALHIFHENMELHLGTFAPERVRVAGPEATRIFVANGIKAARARGLNQRGPIRLWLEIMCVLGHDFDTDPQYRQLWPELDPAQFPMPFAQHLQRNVTAYLASVFGPERLYLSRAIAGALKTPVAGSGDTAADLVGGLQDMWPEKLEISGPEPFAALAAITDAQAENIGLHSDQGRFLVAMLACCFGAGILHDPLYPWLHARLSAPQPEEKRIERTRDALRKYAAQAARGMAAVS